MNLSVVIPCYNEAHLLEETIQTITKVLQNYKVDSDQIEVILGVEKNTAGTTKVARNLAIRYPYVKVFENDRCYGKGYTVRKGVLNSTGEYVLVADADLPFNLDKYFPIMQGLVFRENVAAVYATALGDKTDPKKRGFVRSRVSFFLFVMRYICLNNHITDTQFGCKLYRGDIVRKYICFVEENGYLYELPLTDLLLASGHEIEECSVRIDDFSSFSSVSLRGIFNSGLTLWRYILFGKRKLMKLYRQAEKQSCNTQEGENSIESKLG